MQYRIFVHKMLASVNPSIYTPWRVGECIYIYLEGSLHMDLISGFKGTLHIISMYQSVCESQGGHKPHQQDLKVSCVSSEGYIRV